MSFAYASYNDSSKVKVDLIFIPAIGADPKSSFARQVDREDHERIDLELQDRLHPFAHVHLYDHLTPNERGLQVPRRQSRIHTVERSIEDTYIDNERAVSQFGVKEWASRLLLSIRDHRAARKAGSRPIIFVCHSTGGNVLKQALIEKDGPDLNDIANNTIAITFFAVPHHGSTALSKDNYVQEIKGHLGLKWAMSSRLRDDFRVDSTSRKQGDYNEGLQSLNHRFAVDLAGVKIYTYAEISDTRLTLLRSTNRGAEDQETVFRECIVDSRSGKLGTAQIPIEDEDHMQIDLSHTELPRFTNQDEQLELYISAIRRLVMNYNDSSQQAYRKLRDCIMTEVRVNVHEFYTDNDRMKILLAQPDLLTFLRYGPAKAMSDRLEGKGDATSPTRDRDRPQLTLQVPTDPKDVPQFVVESVDADQSSNDDSADLLVPPQPPIPKNIHTHRPPAIVAPQLSSDGKLGIGSSLPSASKNVHFASEETRRLASSRGPKPSAAIHLPEKAGFRWIHIPFTHPGWVHQTLATISEEKKDLNLHENVLMNKLWLSQHNQARHASPHARFVRPSVRFLFPKGTEEGEGLGMIPSSCSDVQVVAYLPYLHWDSYLNMKRRAEITDRRLKQELTSPIPAEVAESKSTEYKLIWQGLTLDRPLHCRRTLDQYGYPALRNTKVRDDDQILYKRTKEDSGRPLPTHRTNRLINKLSLSSRAMPASQSHVPKVLMVDQLWMWIINGETVVTFFPGRENDDQDGYSREGDVRSLLYQDINGDFANPCNDPYDFAALAVRHAIRALLAKTTDRNLQVFRIFEEYISILTEKQNSSWKKFRGMQNIPIQELDSEKHINNEEDLNALLELRDIEDELKTVDKLLREQATVISEMLRQYIDSLNPQQKGLKGTEFLADISAFIQEQREQVTLMRDSTSVAQAAYKDLLDMKQKQANVLEARIAGQQSQVANRQSRAVLIFTIFTIIFLPLSFFASVFGINSREWSGTGNNYMPLSQIFTYMLTISFGCIMLALLAAFSRSARRHVRQLYQRIGTRFFPAPLKSTLADGGTSSSSHEKWDRGNDPEKQAASIQQKRDDGRLSFLSRSHTMDLNEKKFEKDMQERGGSFTGWWTHHHKPSHEEDDGQMSPTKVSFVNGHAK